MSERPRRSFCFAWLLGLSVPFAVPLAAAGQTQTFEGIEVTGINRFLGDPVVDTGPETSTLGFETDPFFLTVFGAPPPASEKLNVPLRSVAAIKAPDGTRGPLRGNLSVSPLEPSRVANTPPITLGRWLEAEGTAKVRCTGSRGFIEIRFKSLIPHGLYTTWSGGAPPWNRHPRSHGHSDSRDTAAVNAFL